MFVKNMIMKKVLMFMAIMIAVVSFSSCNSLEDKAKKQLRTKFPSILSDMKNNNKYPTTLRDVVASFDGK